MNGPVQPGAMHALTPAQSAASVEQARLLFRRHLASWASDLMTLRAAGLDRPGPWSLERASSWSKAA